MAGRWTHHPHVRKEHLLCACSRGMGTRCSCLDSLWARKLRHCGPTLRVLLQAFTPTIHSPQEAPDPTSLGTNGSGDRQSGSLSSRANVCGSDTGTSGSGQGAGGPRGSCGHPGLCNSTEAALQPPVTPDTASFPHAGEPVPRATLCWGWSLSPVARQLPGVPRQPPSCVLPGLHVSTASAPVPRAAPSSGPSQPSQLQHPGSGALSPSRLLSAARAGVQGD